MKQHHVGARAHEERLAVIRAELMRRIRPVCAHMPDDFFLEMIESMAALQLKYELREAVASD